MMPTVDHSKSTTLIKAVLLKTTCGQATLQNLADWQQSLNLTLGSKGHAMHTAYVRSPIDVNDMMQPSLTQAALLAKYPLYGEIDQELLKATMCTAHGISVEDMALAENADTRSAIKRAMGTRLLNYEDKKSIIAGVILDSIDEAIRRRILTMDAAGIVSQEPRVLYYVILHLVAPDTKSRMLEVNTLLTDLNAMVPTQGEELDAFHDRYATALRVLLTLGHKELAYERATHFIKSLAHNDAWMSVLEREEQSSAGEWFHGEVRANVNISSQHFAHMAEIVLRKLRAVQGFRNWIRPTAQVSQAHATIQDKTQPTQPTPPPTGPLPTDKCRWCTNVLNLTDVSHPIQNCFQITGLIDGYKKDNGKDLLATLAEIAKTGAQPRYLTRDRIFSAQPHPDSRRGNDPRNAQGRGRGGGGGRGQQQLTQQAHGSARPYGYQQPQSQFPVPVPVGSHNEQARSYAATASASNAATHQSALSFMYDTSYDPNAFITVAQSYAALLPPDIVLSDYLFWDCACDTNTFCDSTLVTNCIQIEARKIKGVGTAMADKAGDCIFGDVLINPSQGVNLVSQSYVKDSGLFKFRYDEDQDEYIVWTDLVTLTFARLGGLYAMHRDDKVLKSAMEKHAAANAFLTRSMESLGSSNNLGNAYSLATGLDNVNTVLPLHARERAALTRRLHVTMGHPSDHALEKALMDLANTNLTPHDVKNMKTIYGECMQCVQGKSKHKISGGTYHPARLPGEVIHADLITVPTGAKTSATMLIAVDELSSYGVAADLVSKSENPLYEKMEQVINSFKAKGAHVRQVKTDPENALKVLKTKLLTIGVDLENCPVGEHEKHAEARIGALRAKIRCMESSMHFFLPLSMSTYLVKAANRLMNYLPTHRTGNMSPHTVIQEQRPDAKHLTLMFGESVLVTDPAEHTSTNVRDERANLAIYLGQSDDGPQSGSFLMLDTLTVKTRGISTARPTPYGPHILSMITPLYKGVTYTQENSIVDRIITVADRAEYIIKTRVSTKPVVDKGGSYVNDNAADNKSAEGNEQRNNDKGVEETELRVNDDKGAEEIQERNEEISDTESLGSSNHLLGNRKSARVSRLPSHLAAFATIALLCSLARDIVTFGKPGEDAATREIRQILDTEALIPTSCSSMTQEERREALECKLFLEAKRDGRIKGRFVGGTGASSQDKSKYVDLSSPTVRFETIAILMKSAATTGMRVAVADIPGAYLHAKFEDLTTGATPGKKRYVVARGMLASMMAAIDGDCEKHRNKETGILYLELNKALYGLIEAAKLWYAEVSTMLLSQGFTQSLADPCVFIHHEKQLLIGLYVDDMITFFHKDKDLTWFLNLLNEKYGKPRVQMGPTVDYLNVEITQLERGVGKFQAGSYVASQQKYLQKLVQQYPKWFWDDRTATAPYSEDLFLETSEEPAENPKEFVGLVMSLLYVCTRARPDIFLAESYLCTRSKAPSKSDERKLMHLCSYILNTINLVLIFTPSRDLQVISWVDASYAIHVDAKSHSGTIITAGMEKGSPAFVRSRKQKLVSRSSTESELYALHDASPQVMWTRQLFQELGHAQGPATIYQDNKSTIFMAERGSGNFNRTRHIAVRYFSIKQLVDEKHLQIVYLPTGEMKADPLTKPIVGNKFIQWRDQILFPNPV